ncbi:hypothetical protein D4R86_03720 [bacterium]|nr:MAG: hypothetical protein D4R86_03720 [bacterium]
MAVVSYILGLIFITGLSLVSIVFFIFNIDPDTIKRSELIIFYLSFFLTSSGIFALVGTILRKIRMDRSLSWKTIRPALRQGIILALIVTVIFILLSKDLFDWRIGLLLTASGLLFEGLNYIRD